MKKRLLIVILLVFTVTAGFCQQLTPGAASAVEEQAYAPRKLSYHLALGSQFTSVSGYGSGLSSYITPQFSYRLNKRLSIGAGISVIQTNYFNGKSYFREQPGKGSNESFTSAMIFIDGQYSVSRNLTISGSAWKLFPITQDPLPYNPFNPVSSRGAQGVDLNLGYKIGEHMYIQAGFRYTDGLSPYYNDPFNRSRFTADPFISQPPFGIPRW